MKRHIRELIGVLRRCGCEDITVQQRRHFHIRFTVAGRRLSYLASSTPSDFRAQRNAQADIRRMVRVALLGDSLAS